MKKMNTDSNRSHYNREEYLSPTRFPKKQFELLYRQKQQLPSSEAYESIIFMKSRKCEKKGGQSQAKMTTRGKNLQSENYNKVVGKIEKQFKQQQSNRNKREDDILKSAILKNNANSTFHSKKQSVDQYKSKTSNKINKYHKTESGSCQNGKKYKKMLSPSKLAKNKLSQQATASSQFLKTTQQTFRKAPSSSKDKKRKENKDPFSHLLDFSQPQEYIFLDNNFLSLTPRDLSIIEGKLLSSRDLYSHNKLSTTQERQAQRYQEEPIPQCDQTERVFQEYLQYHDSSQLSERNSVHSAESIRPSFSGNSLNIVQNYLISKVKIIQKWWRLMMQRKLATKQADAQIVEETKENPFEIATQKSIDFGQENGVDAEMLEGSPIKMVSELCEVNDGDNCQLRSIMLREKAALAQKEAHQNILEKLFLSKKINSETYINKNEAVRAKYEAHLQEIEDLKKMLKTNAQKAIEIEKKTIEDLNLAEAADLVIDDKTLDQMLGLKLKAPSNNMLPDIPVLDQDCLPRQKSTGCHFNSEQCYSPSLYKKDQIQEEYQQDFEQYGEGNDIQDTQCREQFFEQEIKAEETNNNLRQLFDEFKLRQQVKADIDRRAAIQMGIITQNILPQLRDQFVHIDTSLNSIHRFILSFFKYYIFYYKFDFLRLINMPYGFNIDKRIKFLQGNTEDQCPEEDEDGVIYGLESIIPEDIFEEFYEKVFDMGHQKMSSAKQANFEFEKVHNRAIFDCFNESLNFFRPYYLINGPPFPWTYSEKALTFYFIAEENIQEVFQKTQFKVLKWASTLCGIIVDKYCKPAPQIPENEQADKIIQLCQQSNHPLLNQTRQQRFSKNQKLQLEQRNYQWQTFENERATNSLESAEAIFNELVEQLCLEFFLRGAKEQGEQPEFFQVVEENSSFSESQIC